MRLNRQYNKVSLRFLIVLLPIIMLHLYLGYSPDRKFSNSGNDDLYSNIYKPLYYLTYFSNFAILPEEETIAIHFFRSVTRYFQYPVRYLYNNQYSSILPLFNFNLSFYLLLSLFKKQVNDTPEIAIHIGGHAPPVLLNF